MITDYFVCYGESAEDLQKNVKSAIEKGWQPFGGVSVALSARTIGSQIGEYRTSSGETREIYCQAVVKES